MRNEQELQKLSRHMSSIDELRIFWALSSPPSLKEADMHKKFSLWGSLKFKARKASEVSCLSGVAFLASFLHGHAAHASEQLGPYGSMAPQEECHF